MVVERLVKRCEKWIIPKIVHFYSVKFFSGFETYICNEGEVIFITDLDSFHFLRFDSVFLNYNYDSQSIDEKLHLLGNQLQLFKGSLSDLKEITLTACINQNDQSQFRDHFQLLDHFSEQVLPICNSRSAIIDCYSFSIDFQSFNDGAADFIAQVLQLRPINRCRKVYFHYANETFIQFPVDSISNWLNRNFDDQIDGNGQDKQQRLLHTSQQIKIQNAVEMWDRLKMVMSIQLKYNVPQIFRKVKIKNFYTKNLSVSGTMR